MSKPRFTPDPPPNLADDEGFKRWAMQMVQRASDYWPRSLENRLKALEQLQSKVYIEQINLAALTGITSEFGLAGCPDDTWTKISQDDIDADTGGSVGGLRLTMSDDGEYILAGQNNNDIAWYVKTAAGEYSYDSLVDFSSYFQSTNEIAEGMAFHYDSNNEMLFLGEPNHDPSGLTNSGRLHIFTGTPASGFTFQQTLSRPGGNAARVGFGRAAAISPDGTKGAICETGTTYYATDVCGQVWLYDISGTTWAYAATIEPPNNTNEFQNFAADVEFINNNRIIVGNSSYNGGEGGAWIYDYTDGNWNTYGDHTSYIGWDSSDGDFPTGIYGNNNFLGQNLCVNPADRNEVMLGAKGIDRVMVAYILPDGTWTVCQNFQITTGGAAPIDLCRSADTMVVGDSALDGMFIYTKS